MNSIRLSVHILLKTCQISYPENSLILTETHKPQDVSYTNLEMSLDEWEMRRFDGFREPNGKSKRVQESRRISKEFLWEIIFQDTTHFAPSLCSLTAAHISAIESLWYLWLWRCRTFSRRTIKGYLFLLVLLFGSVLLFSFTL